MPVAIDQLKTGRKWNDIKADEIEATKFIKRSSEFIDNEYKESLFLKLQDFEEYDESELKEFLQEIEEKKDKIDSLILEYYNQKVKVWIKHSDIHILQKKVIEKLANKLID